MIGMKIPIFTAISVLLLAASPAYQQADQADLVLRGGKIITVDAKNSRAEAVAVKGDKIIYVGAERGAAAFVGEKTKVYDLKGATVVPGLIDSHGHLLGLGQSLRQLNLVGTISYEQIVEMVAKRARETPRGQWILGRGWDQNDWPEKSFPTHHKLSEVSPDHPVLLERIDGHASLANKKALEIAGVNRNTPDPPGGKIHRDKTGEPTGVLIDTAQNLVERHVPEPPPAEVKEMLLEAQRECLRHGLTGVHDAGAGRRTLEAFKELAREGKLKLRVYAMLAGRDGKLLEEYFSRGPEIGIGGNRLTIRSIKLVADGALGSRGAALFSDYSDDPGNKGLLIMSEEEIYSITKRALETGFQVCTHAIGDRANHIVLNAYERALEAVPAARDPRLRIEHAQVISLKDIGRFARLNVIASMQQTHATSDMYWAEARVGPERAKGAYAWRRLLESGARIAGGSDFPVEGVSPLWGLYAAITRQDHKAWPKEGWYLDQRMTREEALRSFTIEAAYAAFEEKTKGSIEVGKLADMVILSKDIMTVPPAELLKTEVVATIVGGAVVEGQLRD